MTKIVMQYDANFTNTKIIIRQRKICARRNGISEDMIAEPPVNTNNKQKNYIRIRRNSKQIKSPEKPCSKLIQ